MPGTVREPRRRVHADRRGVHHGGRRPASVGPRAPAAAGRQTDYATVWTFEHQDFPAHGRVRVRVGASGYVHAGVTQADGRWDPVYEVPVIPAPEGTFEAVLPPDIDAFTFFWTEAPRTPGHPGHWEREEQGGRIFRQTSPAGHPGTCHLQPARKEGNLRRMTVNSASR